MLRRSTFFLYGPLFCALILAAGVLLAHPFVEMGFNDDWSYIWSANVLAQTGRIAYNGWGAMPLGWQLPLGALFLKLFGFSFTAARASVFLVSLAATALMHRIIARCGIGERDATLATLTIVLSPLFFPLSFSYMSDTPAFFCILLCIYSCLRATQAAENRQALAWLAFAAASNVLGGTVRQVAWLGALVIVPCTAWVIRRRRFALPLGLALWICSALAIFACLHWFQAQPYTFGEPLRSKHVAALKRDMGCFLAAVFCASPLLIAFFVSFPFKRRPAWTAALFLSPFLYFPLVYFGTYGPAHWLAPFSIDALTSKGVDIPFTLTGQRPDVFNTPLRVALTTLVLFALVATFYFITRAPRIAPKIAKPNESTTGLQLLCILGPFCACYLALILSREFIFDRYWLPLLFCAVIALVRLYNRTVAPSLPPASYVVLVCLALFTIASTHDLFATLRARLTVARQLEAAAIPRSSFYAGLEYDGWTELMLAGHINNPRIQTPPNSYRKIAEPATFTDCIPWWLSWMPDVHAKYELSYQALPCTPQSQFPPFRFTTWLAPRDRVIYVLIAPLKR